MRMAFPMTDEPERLDSYRGSALARDIAKTVPRAKKPADEEEDPFAPKLPGTHPAAPATPSANHPHGGARENLHGQARGAAVAQANLSAAGRTAERAENDFNRRTPGALGAAGGGTGLTPEPNWRATFKGADAHPSAGLAAPPPVGNQAPAAPTTFVPPVGLPAGAIAPRATGQESAADAAAGLQRNMALAAGGTIIARPALPGAHPAAAPVPGEFAASPEQVAAIGAKFAPPPKVVSDNSHPAGPDLEDEEKRKRLAA